MKNNSQIAIVVLVVLIIALLGYIFLKPKQIDQNQVQVTNTTTAPTLLAQSTSSGNTAPTQVAGYQTFTSSQHGFAIQYPTGFTTNETNDAGYYDQLGLYDLNIHVPSDYQKGTDFGPGFIDVMAGPSTETACYAPAQGPALTATKVINGQTFHYDPTQPMDDSAMGGQRGSVYMYATIHNGDCYRLEETIGYRDSRGFTDPPYPPHYDEQKVLADFDKIFSTFVLK